MPEKIHNITNLRENRKQLRSSLTPAEAKLWSLLKNSQIENKKFRRQHSVGPYVLDFYCVFENTEGVLEKIRRNFIPKQTTPDPSLTKEGSLDADTFNSPPILGGVAEGRGGKRE
jgi:hypothetical protein